MTADSLVSPAAGIALHEWRCIAGRRERGVVGRRRRRRKPVDHVLRLRACHAATKLRVHSSTHEAGGQVVTTLCACVAMGLRASYIGAFGSDDDGERLRRTPPRGASTRRQCRAAVPTARRWSSWTSATATAW
jgi:hypothetical protein